LAAITNSSQAFQRQEWQVIINSIYLLHGMIAVFALYVI